MSCLFIPSEIQTALYELCWQVVQGNLKLDLVVNVLGDMMVLVILMLFVCDRVFAKCMKETLLLFLVTCSCPVTSVISTESFESILVCEFGKHSEFDLILTEKQSKLFFPC